MVRGQVVPGTGGVLIATGPFRSGTGHENKTVPKIQAGWGLAHTTCNNTKSDYLLAEKHLAAWAERNRFHHDELRSRLKG
jgi:hypothetical protein